MRRLGGGLADLSERHPLSFVAGEHALERANAGMHANGSSVSLHFVFQLVARFNSQSLSNFLGNGRLSLARHRGMKHHYVLTCKFILTCIIPITSVAGKARTFHPYPAEAKALPARALVSKVLGEPASAAKPLPM